MPNTYTELDTLFSDISTAIKTKTGSSSAIVADNFPNAISAIPAGAPDGHSWTQITTVPYSNIDKIVYGNGVFIALDPYAAQHIIRSENGITWTEVTISNWEGTVGIAFGNHVFVIMGGAPYESAAPIAYSSDGLNWTVTTTVIPADGDDFDMYATLCFGRGRFVINSQYGVCIDSENGQTWRLASSADSDLGSCYGNNKYVFTWTGHGGEYAVWNADLSERLYTGSFFPSQTYGGSPYGGFVGDKFIFGTDFNNKIKYSYDALTWYESTLPVDGTGLQWGYFTYGNGKYLATINADRNYILMSTNGINWTDITPSEIDADAINGPIIYKDGIFVILGRNGKGAYSRTTNYY